MYSKWTEISYNRFPSFKTYFQRNCYEEWRDGYDDIEEDELFIESEEDTCWDLKNKYTFIL